MSYADENLREWLGDRITKLDELQYEALAWAYHAAILTYPSAAFSRRLVELATEAALNVILGRRHTVDAATAAEHEAVAYGRRVARHALKELRARA